MFNFFNKKPTHPIATLFESISTNQKQSLVNILFLISACDTLNEPHPEELKLLNFYVDIFNIQSSQAMARLKSYGMNGLVSDLQTLNKDQKEMLVTMVHSMICVDGKPNETELESASKFFNAIGIDDDKYVEIVTKTNALSQKFL